MLEVFLVQFLAAALGAASIALADWLYHSSRIRQHLHSIMGIGIYRCNLLTGFGLDL
jgi:hypothetical protein